MNRSTVLKAITYHAAKSISIRVLETESNPDSTILPKMIRAAMLYNATWYCIDHAIAYNRKDKNNHETR